MKWNRERNVETFLGCDNDYEDSRIVVFGAPFDSTSSFRPGSRFAPKAMRTDSWGLETYSPYQDRDLDFIPIFDGGDLELPFGDTELALKQIEDFVEGLADDGKLPFMIGGEHLVTLGAVKALAKQHEGLNIIHFDAHTDLRNNYLGVELSHATVMRRVWEIVGDGSIHQFGIRSGTRDEFLWAEEHTKLRKFGFGGLGETVEELRGKPVYVTIDLDVLDTSVFSGTGTPEPGGVGFMQLLDAVMSLKGSDIVGCDLAELAPGLDLSGVSTAVACKVLREMLMIL